MKQQGFFKHSARKEHGGSLSIGKRRSRRPLVAKQPLHITLRSDFAYGRRSLLRHRPLIMRLMKKAATRFHIRIYEHAICGNHLHLLIYGKYREDVQNFFRVFAGHTAQQILEIEPIRLAEQKLRAVPPSRGGSKEPHPKNRRKFWALLLYSRVVSWGREFRRVAKYVIKNTLEALNLIAYTPRDNRATKQKKKRLNSS